MISLMGVFRDGVLVEDPLPKSTGDSLGDDIDDLGPEFHELTRRLESEENAFAWVSLTDPSDAELATVGSMYKLPPLELDDAANVRQRAKIELHEHRAFIVVKLLDYIEETSDIETAQISVFVGHGFAVTVKYGIAGNLQDMFDRVLTQAHIATRGSVAVAHAVLDVAVDDYLFVADEISKDIEQIEESVFSPERSDDSEQIYDLKRENLEIRRALSPLIAGASQLVGDQLERLPDDLRPYFRDVADHVLRAGDTVDANDALLVTILMAHTARQDLQQNRDMRRISGWVAIIAVPTMIAGIYGMNFDFMPELQFHWAYPVVLLTMVSACSFLYYKFKKDGWL